MHKPKVKVKSLKKRRLELNLNVSNIWEALGISKQAYYKYEKHNEVPSYNINKVKEIFGEDIVEEEEEDAGIYTAYMVEINCIYHDMSKKELGLKLGVCETTIYNMFKNRTTNFSPLKDKLHEIFDPLIVPCVFNGGIDNGEINDNYFDIRGCDILTSANIQFYDFIKELEKKEK